MKKVKFSGKLSLNKETIANLNDQQMNEINGGGQIASKTTQSCGCNSGYTCGSTCSKWATCDFTCRVNGSCDC